MIDKTQRRKNIVFYLISYISLMATAAGMFYAYFVYLWDGSEEHLALGIGLSVVFVLILVFDFLVFDRYSNRMLYEVKIERQISTLSNKELHEQMRSGVISSLVFLISGFILLSFGVGLYLLYQSAYGFRKRRIMVIELSKRKNKIESIDSTEK